MFFFLLKFFHLYWQQWAFIVSGSSSKLGRAHHNLWEGGKSLGWTHHNPKKENETVQLIAVLSLKLQTCIDFKWEMKVILAVKVDWSPCQLRSQWKWQMAINYNIHYEWWVSNYTHWVRRITAIDITHRSIYKLSYS